MFHRNDQIRLQNAACENDANNPVIDIIESLHKNELKKTERLSRTSMTDPASVMMHRFLQTAGVKGDAIRHWIAIFNNKPAYSDKLLKDMTPFMRSDRIQALALFMLSFKKYVGDYIPRNDPLRDQKLQKLQETFKNTTAEIFEQLPFIKVSSLTKEYHAQMCDGNNDPYKMDEKMKTRIKVIQQELQHKITLNHKLEQQPICPIYNYMQSCFNKDCTLLHVCALCFDPNHKATDSYCPKSHLMPKFAIGRFNNANKYYERRKNDKRKPYGYGNYNRYPPNMGRRPYHYNNNNNQQRGGPNNGQNDDINDNNDQRRNNNNNQRRN